MRRIAATLAVVAALLFSAGAAWADWDDATAAYERGDYATFFQELLPLAEQGDVDAQYSLGGMYYRGYGVPENNAKAVKWYRKAAEQGHADAQVNLGYMYDNGNGLPENDAEAVKWYLKAAEQGYVVAQFNLGIMYSNGDVIPVNNIKAYMWLSLAKTLGYKDAADRLDIIKKQMTPTQIGKAQGRCPYLC